MASRGHGLAPHSTVDVLEGPLVLVELGEELDELLLSTGAPSTARRPWLDAWVHAFTEWTPWAITVRRAGELVSTALLARRRRLGHTEIAPLGYGPSDYIRLPARDEEAVEALATALVEALSDRRGPWRLILPQLPHGDPVLARLATALEHTRLTASDPAPALRFQPGDDVRSMMSRNSWNKVRKARNRLERRGASVEYDFVRDADQVRALVPQLEAISNRRDEALKRAQALASPTWVAFRAEALSSLAERGELEVSLLRVDGDIAAFGASLLDGSSYQRWWSRFDPVYAPSAPGWLLTVANIERLLAGERFREYDYMRGDEPHKMRFSNVVIPTDRLLAWSSGALRAAEQWARAARARLRGADSSPVESGTPSGSVLGNVPVDGAEPVDVMQPRDRLLP